jgi:hypothetical protein
MWSKYFDNRFFFLSLVAAVRFFRVFPFRCFSIAMSSRIEFQIEKRSGGAFTFPGKQKDEECLASNAGGQFS